MGRPSKYTPTIQKKADQYLADCGNEYWDYHQTRGSTSDSYERKVKINLPSNDGLAIHLGVVESTVYLWAEKHPIFSETLALIKQLQKKMLLSGGLNGDYNSAIAKLILSANHGMTDRIDHTSAGEALSVSFDNSFNKDGAS